MRIVLDSNEYIFAFQERRDIQVQLFRSIISLDVCIPNLILQEVIRNMNFSSRNASWEFRNGLKSRFNVMDDRVVPSTLISKYHDLGLKDADAFIAAFTEYIGADVLVTENRHFLDKVKITEFKKMSAQQFLSSELILAEQ